MKKILKITAICAAVLILIVVVLFIVVLVRMVTPEEAQKASQTHSDDIKVKIMSVPGYEIVKQGQPSAKAIQDEIGSKDYSLYAGFLVKKLPSGSVEADVKVEISDFAQRLPSNDYGVTVENTPVTDGQPMLICVYASRYLNDDGTYIPQGSTANSSKYIANDEFSADYASGCAELL